ncbi:anthranilate phosphoribosyltransferase [Tessaracoccus sp. MC1679]|uniref:anthranilate phosphoribosyltransferase n=1 Tax=Tessaracoccus sp. MC1679 TaxID=2760313 RepID=UPI0015FED185|nr:anthranilate phosphoribosyltransferase [Tessaracoccus sp. MC1679]MBB1516546.1 anthranilate phosphoribosyltransferase [Tessaracoccus sp. MC1679]
MSGYTWPDILTGLVRSEGLESTAATWALNEILAGRASEVQIAALLTALRAKGESEDEIAGLADAMLANALPIALDPDAVDIVGTGGDRANTVNISTMAAIVAAGAGAKVVKHGSRAASSMAGTADTLEALGVRIDVEPAKQALILDEVGIVFLFAQLYHPAMKNVAGVRKALGIQTTFNFLGPLANPARPRAMALGVANDDVAPVIARVLAERGTRGMVFRGFDGLDELTTTSESDVWMISEGRVHRTVLNPEELGLEPAAPHDLHGGDAPHNAQVARDMLAGKPGPVRDIVVLNAAAALLAYRGISTVLPLVDQMREPLKAAQDAVDSGAAASTLDRWVEATNR